MLLLSGPANTRCSVYRFDSGSGSAATPIDARNEFGGARDWKPKSPPVRPQPSSETACRAFEPAKMPANCALFVRDQETPVRIGLRGGAGRIRTIVQTIINSRAAHVPRFDHPGDYAILNSHQPREGTALPVTSLEFFGDIQSLTKFGLQSRLRDRIQDQDVTRISQA